MVIIHEKVAIAKNYIIKRQIEQNGLKSRDIKDSNVQAFPETTKFAV